MNDLFSHNKQPFVIPLSPKQGKLSLHFKDNNPNDKDQIILKLRSQLMEKDVYIAQLEQKLHRHQSMLSEANKQLEKIKLIEQSHTNQFQNYFDQPSTMFNEKFLSPMNYRQITNPDQDQMDILEYRSKNSSEYQPIIKTEISLSPITKQMKVLNDDSIAGQQMSEQQIIQMDTNEFKTKIQKESSFVPFSKKDELTQSKNSQSTYSSHSNKNSYHSGIKRVSQHLTNKPIQKLFIEHQDISNPLEDTVLQLQSTPSKQNQKLYEEFFYLGASTLDIMSTVQNFIKNHGLSPNNLPTLKAKSSILYRYVFSIQNKQRFSANKSIFKNESLFQQELKMKGLGTQMMINQFIFPFGIDIKKLSAQDGDSQVNEILFANYPIDNNPNCFVIPVNQNQDETIRNSKVLDLKEKQISNIFNPSNTLYYVCVKFNDFIDTTKNQRNEEGQLWSHQRVVCISTKFPFVQFFFELLISFLNDVKLERIKSYKNHSSFSQVDSDYCIKQYLNQKINEKLSQSLTSIALLTIPNFNQNQNVEFYGQNVVLSVPHQQLLDRVEIDWVYNSFLLQAITHLMQNFTSQQIIQIYTSIILEQTVVFVCKYSHILTCAVIIFYKTLLQPLKWIHPLITSLPEEYLDLLDSPVPLIAGLIKDPQYIEKIKLYERYLDIIFVVIKDKNIEIINSKSIPQIPQSISRHFKDKLDPYFEMVNEQNLSEYFIYLQVPQIVRNRNTTPINPLNNMVNIQKNHTPSNIFEKSKQMDLHSKEACYKIIEQFQLFFKKGVVQNLPKNPVFIQKRYGDPSLKTLLDYEKIGLLLTQNVGQQFSGSQTFWKQLFRTQIFIYFLDEFYSQN